MGGVWVIGGGSDELCFIEGEDSTKCVYIRDVGVAYGQGVLW